MIHISPDRLNHAFSSETRKGLPAKSQESSQQKSKTYCLCQCLFDSMHFLFFPHSFSRKRKIIQRKNSSLIVPSQKIGSLKRRTTLVHGTPDYQFKLSPQSQRTFSTDISKEFSSSESKTEESANDRKSIIH